MQPHNAVTSTCKHTVRAPISGMKLEVTIRNNSCRLVYSAQAWFGVGCYYMASRQFEQARRFFAKATQLDKHNAHAWIGFGHAFAEQVCASCGC